MVWVLMSLDFARRRNLFYGHDLVARRNEADLRPAIDGDTGNAECRENADVKGRQRLSPFEHDLSFSHVFAGEADVLTAPQAPGHLQIVCSPSRVFLHNHAIRGLRQHCARSHVDCLAVPTLFSVASPTRTSPAGTRRAGVLSRAP